MAWLQVETVSGQRDPAPIEAVLTELGAVAIWLRDAGDTPVLEPAPGSTPLWPDSIVTALFPGATDSSALRGALQSALGSCPLKISTVEDRDWQAEWQATLKAQAFGTRLWLVPGGVEPPVTNAVIVRLEPGLAFGSGEHPTTAMCLVWLEQLTLEDRSVLDYGCGSGVLAVAAVALGARQAAAVDIDPQALEATGANADNNDCREHVLVATPGDLPAAAQYDVLVANILSGTLIELAPTLAALVRPGAALALTGILAGQASSVRAAWSDWATLEVSAQDGDWVLLSGTRH